MAPVIVGVVALVGGRRRRVPDPQERWRRSNAQSSRPKRRSDWSRPTAERQAEQEAAQTLRKALEDAKNDAADPPGGRRGRRRPGATRSSAWNGGSTDAEDELSEARTAKLDLKAGELDERDEKLAGGPGSASRRSTEQQRAQLERVAGMTSSEARDQLMAEVVDDAKRAAMAQVREIEQRAREEGEERARKILTIAIQRVASEQTAESTVSVFALPSEDMKGRIIGREGRNIRAFEATTGVNLIIDDTPEAVVLRSFDPVRREAARLTLEKLVQDGRIHPARIEEVHERSLARDRRADPARR